MKIVFRLLISAIIMGALVIGGIFVYNNYFKKTTTAFALATQYYAESSRIDFQNKLSNVHTDYIATNGHSAEMRFDELKNFVTKLDDISKYVSNYLSTTKIVKKDVKSINKAFEASSNLRKEAILAIDTFTIILSVDFTTTSDIEDAYNDCYTSLYKYLLQYNNTLKLLNNYVIKHYYHGNYSNFNIIEYKIFFDIVDDAYMHMEDNHIIASNLNNLNKFLSKFTMDVYGNVKLNSSCVGDLKIAHPFVASFLESYKTCDHSAFASQFLINLGAKVDSIDENTTNIQKAVYYYSELLGVV